MTLFRDQPDLLPPYRAGAPAALERVYWTYVDLVDHIIRYGVRLQNASRVAGASVDARADLVQDTFLRAFRPTARLAFDGARLFRPYLSTICRNVLIDWSRRLGREIALGDLEQPEKADTGEPDVEEDAPWSDPAVLSILAAYVHNLDPKQRAVYERRYVQCLSQNEASQLLGMTRQQIRTVETKLRAGLARALQLPEPSAAGTTQPARWRPRTAGE